MENLSYLKTASIAIGGIALTNIVGQSVWKNHTIRRLSIFLSFGGALQGLAATIGGIGGLIFPFTYDSPHTWNKGGLAHYFSNLAKDGLLLTTISAIAFVII